MPSEDALRELAEAFVKLVSGRTRAEWEQVTELPPTDMQMLLEVLTAAGFEPLQLYHRMSILPDLCPFNVVNQENGKHYFASRWLRCLFFDVIYHDTRYGYTAEELTEQALREIIRSVPFAPIRITDDEDFLREPEPRPHGNNYFVDHVRDKTPLEQTCIGVHQYCGGFIDRRRVTQMKAALVCRGCHLQVRFPVDTATYGELRGYFATMLRF